MVNFYVSKIQRGDINPKTGEAWKVADVPVKWRAAVEEALAG